MGRGDLTDKQWERLEPHLPPKKPKRGRPNTDHRRILNGILWIDRTGAPWRDLPERYGPWQTIASRFYRWRAAGVWDRILAAVQQLADAAGRFDWAVHYVDGTIVRAHQHAAGARGGDAAAEARGGGGGGRGGRSAGGGGGRVQPQSPPAGGGGRKAGDAAAHTRAAARGRH